MAVEQAGGNQWGTASTGAELVQQTLPSFGDSGCAGYAILVDGDGCRRRRASHQGLGMDGMHLWLASLQHAHALDLIAQLTAQPAKLRGDRVAWQAGSLMP